jgi:hypothetical protein
MRDLEVRWKKQPNGVPLFLLALAVAVLWVMARHAVAPAGQVEQWSALPAGVEPRAVPAAVGQPLRQRAPHPHSPPTWQQERELARSDLHSLCRQARQLAKALEDNAGTRSGGGRNPTAVEVGRKAQAALARAAQEEARVEAQLDHARGFADIDAAWGEIAEMRDAVRAAQQWFRARRASGDLGVPRHDTARRGPAGPGDRPPAGAGP